MPRGVGGRGAEWGSFLIGYALSTEDWQERDCEKTTPREINGTRTPRAGKQRDLTMPVSLDPPVLLAGLSQTRRISGKKERFLEGGKYEINERKSETGEHQERVFIFSQAAIRL